MYYLFIFIRNQRIKWRYVRVWYIIFLFMEQKQSRHRRRNSFEKRIHEIDFFRGILIIMVILDHVFWNLGNYGGLWGIDWMHDFFYNWYWKCTARQIIQPMALMAFCFVSGISCSFSRNNWKRTLEIFGVFALIAVCSNLIQWAGWFGDRSMRVDFNIIGVLTVCMFIYCLIQNRTWRSIVAVILVCFLISQYSIPYFKNACSALYGTFTVTRGGHATTNPNFYFPFFWEPKGQSDYMPLFPYIMFFFLGALVSYFVYKDKRKSIIPHKGNWERPICFMGRHTLILYFGHEAFLIGLFALLDAIIGR